MEKLTLEHLALYIPYRLKRYCPTSNVLIHDYLPLCFIQSTIDLHSSFGWKPILRPMSDLTWQMLSDLNFNSHKDYLTIEREHWISIKGRENWLNDIPFGKIQWLAKNHYDYNGLIQNGLAISIHDVNKIKNDKNI